MYEKNAKISFSCDLCRPTSEPASSRVDSATQLPDMNEVNLELPFPFLLRIGAIFSHFIVGRYNL